MPVLTRLIPSPVFVDISRGAMDDLAGLLADQRISASGKLAIAISAGSGQALRETLAPALPGADWYCVAGGNIDAAVQLADDIKGKRYDAVVGLGGGKIIDVAKYAAARVGLPWSRSPRTSPTTASARPSPRWTTTTAGVPTASRCRSPWSSTSR